MFAVLIVGVVLAAIALLLFASAIRIVREYSTARGMADRPLVPRG